MPEPKPSNPTFLVFSDDWGRHPSSCQHLISRLVTRYQVGWVNTIGTRAPRLDLSTVRRGFEKLRHWSARETDVQELPENLTVLNPVMWPWFRRRFDRVLNRSLLERQLKQWIEAHDGPVIGITTLPITADIMDRLPISRWVYYCVDDFGQWPGLDQKTLQTMEKTVIERADCLIAVSETLQQKLKQNGKPVHLLTHGVELEHWHTNGASYSSKVIDLEVEQPLIVFWGVIDRRMDVELLRCLSRRLSTGTILLVGPQADPDPALQQLDRVRIVPPVSYDELPALGMRADVLIMPYANQPVTRAMQPLKLLEYMSTGKPVVVRDLPSTTPWQDCLDLASSPIEFCERVIDRLKHGISEQQTAARSRLSSESWSQKAAEFERLLVTPLTQSTQVAVGS